MSDKFQLAHDYFKRVFSGDNPMNKKYSIKDFPDVNKLIIVTKKKVNQNENTRK